MTELGYIFIGIVCTILAAIGFASATRAKSSGRPVLPSDDDEQERSVRASGVYDWSGKEDADRWERSL